MNELQKNIGFISLGCDKNRVDLERIMNNIYDANLSIVNNYIDADVIIINTCSFIAIAREESYGTLKEISTLKSNGKIEKIIVTGCLNQMGYSDLLEKFPLVDAFVPISENKEIVKIIYGLYGKSYELVNQFEDGGRILTTDSYAFLKISEGCNHFCSYCKIPYIRGRYISDQIDNLIVEATNIVESGIKEIILVAQDITRYGEDLGYKNGIVTLIQELSKIEDLEWIRLLYCYPENITDELIAEIKNNAKVCKYIDMPFQHVNNDILKKMNRKNSYEKIVTIINKLRTSIPEISIRSTFIIGFPGETEEQFAELCDFIKTFKLDNVGFFSYSNEEGTLAYSFDNQILEEVKTKRVETISEIQYQVILENNKKYLNSTQEVIVDSIYKSEARCRSQFQSPNIDGIIFVQPAKNMQVGELYNIKITNLINYDFKGEKHE